MKATTKSDARVTRLVAQQRDPARVNVFLDGKYAFSLSADEVIKRQLAVGQSLSRKLVAELESLSDEEKLFAKLLNFLSYRPRSVKEVRDRLYQYVGKGEDELKTQLIARLTHLGYLDDLQFARWFAHSRATHRPRSTRHLASELYAKGIDQETVSLVLQEAGDDREAIRRQIAKKAGYPRDKLVAYLARQGFSWEMIREELPLASEVDKSSLKR